MVISLNTNLLSMPIGRNLYASNNSLQNISEKLSSGIKINSASDDAANLTLSKKLSSTSSGLDVASRNIQTSLTKLQTFDGYLNGISNSLQRMRDLAIQSLNGTYSDSERAMLNKEAQQLTDEVQKSSKMANADAGMEPSKLIDTVNVLSVEEATAAGYTLINDAQELVDLVNADFTGKYILMDNINMAELGTLNSSAINGAFTGEFNGNGKTISNLTIETSSSMSGLFRNIDTGGIVENVIMENTKINSTSNSVGSITGRTDNATIRNCSSVNMDLHGNGIRVGGIVGNAAASGATTVQNCYTSGNVSSNSESTGGIAGYLQGNISNCFSSVNIKGNNYTGGIVGSKSWGTLSNSYSTGKVSGSDNIGGLAGQNDGTISTSYSLSSVSGNNNIGTLVGENTGTGNVQNNVFWNSDLSSIAIGNNTGTFSAVGLTSSEICNESAPPLDGWSSATWNFSTGTPSLMSTKSQNGPLSIQISEEADASSLYTIEDLELEMDLYFSISNKSEAKASIEIIDNNINYLSEKRAELGTHLNNMEKVLENTGARKNKIIESNSTIRDTDVAIESSKLLKEQILQQSSLSLLQQANNSQSRLLLSLY